jgi:hypothetical protein
MANKHVSTAINQHTTIDALLETVFSMVAHAEDKVTA